MSSSWQDSVILITGNTPRANNFGTGFAVYRDQHATYILTCAHVVSAIDPEPITIRGCQATVVASNNAVDLAVLRLNGLQDIPVLYIGDAGKQGFPFITAGFQKHDKTFLIRELYGVLGREVGTEAWGQADRTRAWDLQITDNYALQFGYSGSPVVAKETGKVIGVVSTKQGDDKGVAISIEELRKVWSNISFMHSETDSPHAFVANLPSIRNQDLFAALISIIKDLEITEKDIKEFYQSSVPEDILSINKWLYPKEEDYDKVLPQVLEQLADACTPENGMPPILKFVKQLAHHANSHKKDLHEKIQRWIEEFASAWDISTREIAGLIAELEALRIGIEMPEHFAKGSRSLSPSLLIKLERKNGSKAFFVKAWLRRSEEEEIIPLPLSASSNIFEKAYTTNNISIVLQRLLEDIIDFDKIDWKAKTKLRIEFFLPCELFDEEVENWSASDKQPLGMLYQVVIRSSERAKVHEAFWKEKWEKVQNYSKVGSENFVHWIHNPLIGYDSGVYTMIAAYLTEPHVVCCCLTRTPSEIVTSRNKKDLFRAVVTSGTPIALWPRKLPNDPQEACHTQEMLKLLLSKHKLSKLPEVVLQQRKDARKGYSKYHLGYHLALMWDEWDNPKRLPPKETKLQETRIRS